MIFQIWKQKQQTQKHSESADDKAGDKKKNKKKPLTSFMLAMFFTICSQYLFSFNIRHHRKVLSLYPYLQKKKESSSWNILTTWTSLLHECIKTASLLLSFSHNYVEIHLQLTYLGTTGDFPWFESRLTGDDCIAGTAVILANTL